jgi:transcriptional regulator with XRE-family HTH domain
MSTSNLTLAKSQVLHDLRLEKGWTLRKVSSVGLITTGYLSEIERGKKQPSDEVLGVLLKAFDVSPADFLRQVADLVE